jgi:tetratricopeptide (TPR) repeat protein
MESYRRARALLGEILSASPDNAYAIRSLANVAGNMAVLLNAQGDVERAQAMHREAAQLLEATARRSSSLPALKAAALAQWNMASGSSALHDWEAALRGWKQVLASYEQLARLQPGDDNALRNVALSHKRLGAIFTQREEAAAAERHYREAERIDRARAASDPSNFEAKADLAFDLSDLGLVLAGLNRPEEAMAKYAESLALRRKLAAADPNDRRALGVLPPILRRMGVLSGVMGEFEAGIAYLGEAERILAELCAGDPANLGSGREHALTLLQLGAIHAGAAERKSERADWAAALRYYERAREGLALLPAEMRFTAADRKRIDEIPGALERCRKALGR